MPEETPERRSYRKVYRRLWTNPKFLSLIDGERVLTLYLLTGPQTNRIGLFKLSLPMAAEDLARPLQTVRRHFAKVIETFGWQWDADAKVLWIQSWWKHNPPPPQPKNFKGLLADRNDVLRSVLLAKFNAHRRYVPAALHEQFGDSVTNTVANTVTNTAPPVNRTQDESVPTALSTKHLSTKQEALSRDAPSVLDVCARDDGKPAPLDRWWFELSTELYPQARRSRSIQAEQAFFGVFTKDVRLSPWDVWEEFKARLERQKRSAEWRRGMVPRLDRYLLEGLYLNELPESEPGDRVGAQPASDPWECPHLEPCSSRSMCDQATFLNRPLKGVLV